MNIVHEKEIQKYNYMYRKLKEMKLSSSAFDNNGLIPLKYICDGDGISPLLVFTNIPVNTKSLALIVDDPDAGMEPGFIG